MTARGVSWCSHSGCSEQRPWLGLTGLPPDRGERPVLMEVCVGGCEEDELGERSEALMQRGDARVAGCDEEELGEDGVAVFPGAGAGVGSVAVELRVEPLDRHGAEVDLDEEVVELLVCLVAGVAVGAEKQRRSACGEAMADRVFALPPLGRAAVACVGTCRDGKSAGEVCASERVPHEQRPGERVPCPPFDAAGGEVSAPGDEAGAVGGEAVVRLGLAAAAWPRQRPAEDETVVAETREPPVRDPSCNGGDRLAAVRVGVLGEVEGCDLAAGEEAVLVERLEDVEVAFREPRRRGDQLLVVHGMSSAPSFAGSDPAPPRRRRIATSTSSTGRS